MLGHDLDRAIVLHIDDAAADRLAIGKIDEDVVARLPTALWLVHAEQDAPAMPLGPVGFQNTGMALDQWFQAATSYSLRSPPKIDRRRILPWTSAGTGDVGRGGRNRNARCGRAVL